MPPTDDVLETAMLLNCEAGIRGFTKTNAFPGISGEVQVTIYHGEHYLEFTIEPNGSITFVYEENDEEKVYEEDLSFSEAIKRVDSFKERIWASLGLSTRNIMIPIKSGLTAWPSNLPVPMVESPSLKESAPYEQVRASASTSKGSINVAIHLSSGTFPEQYCPLTAGSSKRTRLLEILAILIS
jgi:hypothetical protein